MAGRPPRSFSLWQANRTRARTSPGLPLLRALALAAISILIAQIARLAEVGRVDAGWVALGSLALVAVIAVAARCGDLLLGAGGLVQVP